jgi:chromosome segregation ATPase
MEDQPPTPKLRRAWLSGYRVADVEVLLAELRFKVTHLRDETQRLTVRLTEVERHRSELEQRVESERPTEPGPEKPAEPGDRLEDPSPAEEPAVRRALPTGALAPRAILGTQYSRAVAGDPDLRRSRLGGYRRGDVEAALAHERLLRTRLELDLEAALQRIGTLEVEIHERQARIDAAHGREATLTQALDEVRERREQTERESRHRAEQLIREAEESAAAMKTEGLRQVGELQAQVEALLGMRTSYTHTMRQLSEDLAAAMARLAASPATAIDYRPEDQLSRWAPPED